MLCPCKARIDRVVLVHLSQKQGMRKTGPKRIESAGTRQVVPYCFFLVLEEGQKEASQFCGYGVQPGVDGFQFWEVVSKSGD
jgi:hypothetical protein